MAISWRFLGFAALLTLAFGTPGAAAFSWSSSPSSVDLKAGNRIADPEDLMNEMSPSQSGGAQTHSFANGTVQFSAPPSTSAGVESRFVTNPSTVLVPSHR